MQCARSAISSACVLALSLTACGTSVPPVVQPIDFSHKRHIAAEIDCSTCHEKVADAPAATLPQIRVCAKCHKELKGKDPAREQPIVTAVAQKQQLPWVQVNRLPGHVYFSHRSHVGFAEMACETCHGAVKDADHPFTSSGIGALSMGACITCHQAKGAPTDCTTCHK